MTDKFGLEENMYSESAEAGLSEIATNLDSATDFDRKKELVALLKEHSEIIPLSAYYIFGSIVSVCHEKIGEILDRIIDPQSIIDDKLERIDFLNHEAGHLAVLHLMDEYKLIRVVMAHLHNPIMRAFLIPVGEGKIDYVNFETDGNFYDRLYIFAENWASICKAIREEYEDKEILDINDCIKRCLVYMAGYVGSVTAGSEDMNNARGISDDAKLEDLLRLNLSQYIEEEDIEDAYLQIASIIEEALFDFFEDPLIKEIFYHYGDYILAHSGKINAKLLDHLSSYLLENGLSEKNIQSARDLYKKMEEEVISKVDELITDYQYSPIEGN